MNLISDREWNHWMDLLATENYLIIDGFLPDALYSEVRRYIFTQQELDAFTKAAIGTMGDKQIISSVRGDYIYWLDKLRDTALEAFFNLIETMLPRLNESLYLSLSSYEFHLAHYPPGKHYDRHFDQFKGRSNRLLTLVIYLNDEWKTGDGGELRVFLPDGSERMVEPVGNRAILFRTELLEHEVMTTQRDRYSLTGWLRYQPAGLGYL